MRDVASPKGRRTPTRGHPAPNFTRILIRIRFPLGDGRPQGATPRPTHPPSLLCTTRRWRDRHSRDGGGADGWSGPLRASVVLSPCGGIHYCPLWLPLIPICLPPSPPSPNASRNNASPSLTSIPNRSATIAGTLASPLSRHSRVRLRVATPAE